MSEILDDLAARAATEARAYEKWNSTKVGETPDGTRLATKESNAGTNLYVGGWRVGTYKTEGGLQRAITRYKKGA